MKMLVATITLTMLVLTTSGFADLTPPPVEKKHATLVSLPRLMYPDIALQAGIEGTVVVEVRVDTNGKATHARVVSNYSPALEEAVLAAVMGSEFTPATMSEKAVASWIRIPFTFKKVN